MLLDILKDIADGGPFDVAEAVRVIASHLTQGVELVEKSLPSQEQVSAEVSLVEVLGERLAATLVAAGFDTFEKLRAAVDDDLRALKGVGDAALATIRAKVG